MDSDFKCTILLQGAFSEEDVKKAAKGIGTNPNVVLFLSLGQYQGIFSEDTNLRNNLDKPNVVTGPPFKVTFKIKGQ